jgi:hypothetical protein
MTAAAAASMPDELIAAITPDALAEHLRNAGFRAAVAEQNGQVLLTSACQGVGFMVRFGNPSLGPQGEGSFLDFTCSAALQMMGQPLPVLASGWNLSRRFARVSLQGALLVMDMDVSVAGGVTVRHLRAQIELWDRLVQELLFHVRQGIAAGTAAPQPTAAPSEAVPRTPSDSVAAAA